MPPRKRTSPVLNGDAEIDPSDAARVNPADALALAEEAESEALAKAARSRARALKLRRQAEAAAADAESNGASASASASAPAVAEPADVARTQAVEANQSVAASNESADRTDENTDESATAEAALDEGPKDVDAEPARRRRLKLPRIRLKVLAAGLVILCTLGLLAVSGYMIWQHHRVAAEQQRSAEFAAAAEQGVVTLMSVNFTHAQEDMKRTIDNTTGDFKKDFQNATQDFTKVTQASKVITTATVNAAAVQSMTRDTATVLVSATTHVSNAAGKDQPPRTWRLFVDLARDGGQIKLAKVEFVP
jgi:Mce-associated membrane protein